MPDVEQPSHGPQPPRKNVAWRKGRQLRQGPSGSGIADTRRRSPIKSTMMHPGTLREELGDLGFYSCISEQELYKTDEDDLRKMANDMITEMRNDPDPRNPIKATRAEFEHLVEAYSIQEAFSELAKKYDAWQCLQRNLALSPESPTGPAFERPVTPSDSESELPTGASLTSGVERVLLPTEAAAALDHSPLPKVAQASQLFAEDSAIDDNGKDSELCEHVARLVESVKEFSSAFTRNEKRLGPGFFNKLLKEDNRELIRYLGCLAIAGKEGEKSWEKLLTDPSTRAALVVGIVGRALKEHVFADLWFGGSEEERKVLKELERTNVDVTDGFSRTEERAKQVRKYAAKTNVSSFQFACVKTTLQLERLLAPFQNGEATQLSRELKGQLQAIVTDAANLSRAMRQAPDVIYYWPPTFKDEEFEPSRMEGLNLREMILASPYEKKKVGKIERAVLKEGSKGRNEAIVRVVCFPGIVAYRRGGGALAQRELAEERRRHPGNAPPDVLAVRRRVAAQYGAESLTGNEGFRSKVICKSVVFLAWDQQRLLTKEAGTAAHIDAQKPGGSMQKYEDDYKGFVELYDVAKQRWGKPA